MTQIHEITRWDSVLLNGGLIPKPIIYIHPNEDLKHLTENVCNKLIITINTSEQNYNRTMTGVIRKSEFVPNLRYNFFDMTGLYVIILDSQWYGYPFHKGTVTINKMME
jgi:hypothetical protein